MKYYLCKFVPPRPDLLQTMTPAEGELMKRHVAFMNDLMDQQLLVAHGPVDDPAGGWGLSLYAVPDEHDIRATTFQDPMVVHGGARYEICPMRGLKYRG